MLRKIQNKTDVGDKIVYRAKTPNGWSIVIMPDNILFDNYHIGKAHVHPDPLNHHIKIELSVDDFDEVFEIICDYLNFSKVFDISALLEMLT